MGEGVIELGDNYMKKITFILGVLSVFILPFIGCKKTSAPTMPAPPDTMMTVTEIIKISDSARATQTHEAASTSTALAALFTHTATMTITPTSTITITATRTVTATVTCTSTATPPVYVIYDPLVEDSALDPGKWDVQISGAECTTIVFPGLMDLRAKTTVPGTTAAISVLSKCTEGTKAFKGSIILHGFNSFTINDYGNFQIEIGNEQDGFTQKFDELVMGAVFEGGYIGFEIKHLTGNTYTISINGSEPENVVYAHQPQVKMILSAHLTSNYIGSTAEAVYWAKDFYYY